MNIVKYSHLSSKFEISDAETDVMQIHSCRRATVGGHSAIVIKDEMNKLLELLAIDDADDDGVIDNDGRSSIIDGSFSAMVDREILKYS